MSASRVLFLYLRTGGGHRAPAVAISKAIERKWENKVKVSVVDAELTEEKKRISFLEKGYAFLALYLPFIYLLLYKISEIPAVMSLWEKIFHLKYGKDVKEIIDSFNPDVIAIMHPLLHLTVRKAVKGKDVKLFTPVLDPYTPHPSWFRNPDSEYFVASKHLYDLAVNKFKVPESKLHLVPLALDPDVEGPVSEEDKRKLKEKLGFSPDLPMVLIVGGGDGMRGGEKLFKKLAESGIPDEAHLVLSAGRNKAQFDKVKKFIKSFGSSRGKLEVYGFIPFIRDLMKSADVMITKAGSSTLFEVMTMRKPFVIASYIPGQEKGNVDYVVDKKLGFYEKRSKNIVRIVKNLLEDKNLVEELVANQDREGIRNGVYDIAETLISSV